jgi:hypothetical protein
MTTEPRLTARHKKLSSALKNNLRKRKEQQRQRKAQPEETHETPNMWDVLPDTLIKQRDCKIVSV